MRLHVVSGLLHIAYDDHEEAKTLLSPEAIKAIESALNQSSTNSAQDASHTDDLIKSETHVLVFLHGFVMAIPVADSLHDIREIWHHQLPHFNRLGGEVPLSDILRQSLVVVKLPVVGMDPAIYVQYPLKQEKVVYRLSRGGDLSESSI